MTEEVTIRIAAGEMQEIFYSILVKHSMAPARATQCAEVFTANSLDGVYTHGVNRFAAFVKYIQRGLVDVHAQPSVVHSPGALQQWNGHLGPGILNALAATDAALELADKNGIGCIALANTNHWMRAGYYGWHAARKGYALIAWTNTIANMPAWGATDARLGNNPLMFAVPFGEEAIVMDTAMSQFSFGAMEKAVLAKKHLPVAGGYDARGALTSDPAAVLATRRPLPIGYWKGAGLSLLLDIFAAILSGGLATHEISRQQSEHAVSQVFIAINLQKLQHASSIQQMIAAIIDDYRQSVAAEEDSPILYPGERVVATRKDNESRGIPVNEKVWQEIVGLIN